MRKIYYYCLLLSLVAIASCRKKPKTNQERAIALVESRYKDSDQKLNFDSAKLDSLYNISPAAYADSIKKGNELDAALAKLESEIEHLSQAESDSVGLISARFTKERYRLLELAKTKPAFTGWTLTGVNIEGPQPAVKNFNFDKDITKIVE